MSLRSVCHYIQSKHLDKWLLGYCKYVTESNMFATKVDGCKHLLFAVCDHFEPLSTADHPISGVDYVLPHDVKEVPFSVGMQRMHAWRQQYPVFAEKYRDATGVLPQHSFFFPFHEYHPDFLELLGELVERGYGEVEVHLHHEDDTSEGLRQSLKEFLHIYQEHGHLSRGLDGRPRFGFVHGNWCLANARTDGKMCGVDDELQVLFEAGCYADFTFPAAPDEAQPSIVNQVYWPQGDLTRRRSYESGRRACVGEKELDRLLMIQGPLGIHLRKHRMPIHIESGHITAREPVTRRRVHNWVRKNIHIKGRPEWVFVKVDTHGALEATYASLFGQSGAVLHTTLQEHYNDGIHWKLHYVTAREMYNIAMAAMDGKCGCPSAYRNYVLPPPPRAKVPI